MPGRKARALQYGEDEGDDGKADQQRHRKAASRLQRHLHEVVVSEEQLDQPDRDLDSGDGHQHYSATER